MTQGEVKRHNQVRALRAIRDHGGISRAQLADSLALTKVGVSRPVADLLAAGIVVEEEIEHSGPGRRPIGLQLTGGMLASLGFDIRIDRAIEVLQDVDGTIVAKCVIDLPEGVTAAELLGILAERILSAAETLNYRIVGVGVALPAEVDGAMREIRFSLPMGWGRVAFCEDLEELTGNRYRVRLADISGAAALANSRLNLPNLAHLQIGYGAGLSYILAGSLGSLGVVGEFGHIPMMVDGPECICGRRGCLDAVAGFQVMVDGARRLGIDFTAGPDAMNGLSARLAHEAGSGNEGVRGLIEQAAGWMARVVAVVAMIRPAASMTVGGYPLALGEAFWDPFMAALVKLRPGAARLMVKSPLGDAASTVGVGLLGAEILFEDPLGWTARDAAPTRAGVIGSP
ncbi:ROK family transcriptional regulator [Arthrobacter sp.]|uniref:ROK family transcriptional regulator n=1 Tax=Arthrobacter sp. TaxID=1667 RepID=UPI0026E06415|nr:ROK family transcriptional regulator [Arthrobacter sp.]MDO5753604.1 ROK family transcriptional regulator [Arthrobacter sp.]